MISLSERQREAVCHVDGPLLILAGAGSGKTRVVTERIAYLISECGISPFSILAITFTNKAANEMKERVARAVGEGAESIWVSTFHSMCVRILRRHADHIGFDRNFTIYDTEDQKQVIKEVLKRQNIDTKIFKPKMFMNVISSAKDKLITPEEFSMSAGDYPSRIQASVYEEYQSVLKKNNAFDFDDLIVKTVELFRAQPSVLEIYQERFKYINVDEYQDTNRAQFELVRLLADKYKNLCVVGDDDQSIYRFRGADIRNILDFEKTYQDAKIVKLEQNYRSTKGILDAANNVIKNNKGRKGKTLWSDVPSEEKIFFRQFDNANEEADFIARDIALKTKEKEKAYNDFAILYRTNAQSRLIEERFISRNIPYKIVGGVNFYSRKEIKDVLAYLKTIANSSDDLAARRIINVPARKIGQTTINKLSDYALSHDMGFMDAVYEVKDIPGMSRAAAKVDSFGTMIAGFRAKLGLISLKDLVEEMLDTTGYKKELELENTPESKARLENIGELLSKVKDYEESAEEPTLDGFLEEVALIADIDSVDESSDYVLLMTLHASKGLEFDTVYITGLEDGLFPSFMSITSDSKEDIEEERRLMYVGITRAKRHLMLTASRMRMINGETRYSRVSRFIEEIPEELLSGEVPKSRLEVEVHDEGYERAHDTYERKPFASSFARNVGRMKADPHKGSLLDAYKAPQTSTAGAQNEAATAGAGLGYGVGDRVRHVKFKEGTVVKIVSGGRDYEVTVDFDDAGTKKMFAGFAKLVKV